MRRRCTASPKKVTIQNASLHIFFQTKPQRKVFFIVQYMVLKKVTIKKIFSLRPVCPVFELF
jgi:hypothetical protein